MFLKINTTAVEMRKIYFWLRSSTRGSYNMEYIRRDLKALKVFISRDGEVEG